jgi:hypothetical protein
MERLIRMLGESPLITQSPSLDLSLRYEILLIAHRKPEWDWTRDMERAVCTISPNNGALIAAQPQPQPPDPSILFSFAWIDQVFAPMSGMGSRGGGSRYNDRDSHRGAPPMRSALPPPLPIAQVPDYYTGDKPGFIVGCLTPMMAECFSRSLFGLPPNRRVKTTHLASCLALH